MFTSQDISYLLDDAVAITADADRDRAVEFSHSVLLDAPVEEVVSARLMTTAHGAYEARVNGEAIDGSVLNPGWTAYEWRLQVKETDVTDLVRRQPGIVRIDILVGNGWWRGKLGFGRQETDYGSEISLLAALEITYRNGSTQVIRTSEDWDASLTQVVYNSLYNGETIDARIRPADERVKVRATELDRGTLIPQEGVPVMRDAVFHPTRVWQSPSGKTLVDFGQNLVGWLCVRVSGKRGSEIVVRHAEVLEDGEIGVRPLRQAKATDRFILSGGDDFFEPTLTFHGFRYVEIEGWPEGVPMSGIEAVSVHSELRRTGWFECSDDDINQLVHNSVWSQLGNFLDIPTDCPQRDEREGWTGDISAYAPTAAFQFDCSAFLRKWLMDLRAEAEHNEYGIVPMIIPDIIKYKIPPKVGEWTKNATAVWGDAAIWVPQALWNAYGDAKDLALFYPAMKIHLASVEAMLDDSGLWRRGFQFGDWLDPVAPPEDPAAARADKYVIAQACLFRSAGFAEEAARILGKKADAVRWGELANRARVAFNDAYVRDGIVSSDAPAVYALALTFGLLESRDAERAAARLAELVREAGYKVTTGFAGTPYVTWALSEHGYAEDAYRLLTEKECPSWLYPVRMGATTIWERWDSMLPDGKINPGSMTSFNHYALGAVCDWVYQVIGGIRPEGSGYSEIRIQPIPGGGLTWARCVHESPRGRIEVSWKRSGNAFELEVAVPTGIPATIVLPDGSVRHCEGGSHHFGVTLVS